MYKNIQILTQGYTFNLELVNIFPATMRTFFRENKYNLKKFQFQFQFLKMCFT